jgi:hypothetical protein
VSETKIENEVWVFAKGMEVRTVRRIQVSVPAGHAGEMQYVVVPPGKTGTIKQVYPHAIVVFDSDEDFEGCQEISWREPSLLSEDLVPLMDGKPLLKVIK